MTHYTCAIIWRFLPKDQELEFLVIDYRSIDPSTGQKTERQVKFPGGTNTDYLDEKVEQTLFREVFEETGLVVQEWKEIWKQEVNPDHTKYGFLVNIDNCQGGLRSHSISDNGDEIGPPYWFSAKTLGRVLFYSHQPAYLAACRALGVL
ncbi:MAG: NUDIX hydrolase [Candidatus Zambryskibacteria bacterium]|nr:NUDIX hydrolase [Candidatus Zambryskibacteria bacterium]